MSTQNDPPIGPTGIALALTWLVGTLCLTFGQGHYPNAILPIVGIACWIRFARYANIWVAWSGPVLGNVIVWEIAYRGMVPLPTAARAGMELGVSTVLAVAFMLDRRLHRTRRFSPWMRTLVFPSGWVAFELLNARVSPGATWSSIAYSYVDQTGIAQLAALVGWTGITFMVGWLGSVINLALDVRSARPVLAASLVLAFVSVIGELRATSEDSPPTAVAMSLLVPPDTYHVGEHLDEVWMYTRGAGASEEQQAHAVRQIELSLAECERMVRREAESGSRLIVWAEANVSLTAKEEPEWLRRLGQVAREHAACVGMGLVVFRPETNERSENKFVLLGPEGQLVCEYFKRTRPPGASHVVGEGPLPLVETPFGKLSAAICFDLDFPHIIRSISPEADALLAPSNDWTEAGPTHSRMARMRGIENGVWVIRPTKDGVASVSDPYGRALLSQWTDGRKKAVLTGQAQLAGLSTLYTLIGDTFAWFGTAFWLVCLVMGLTISDSPGQLIAR